MADRTTECVWDYPRPPRVERIDWQLRVVHDGMTLAESNGGVRILETSHPPCFYFPPEAVDFSRLIPSGTRTFCEWKGQARYWDLLTDEGRIEDVAWAYAEPTDPAIRNHVSFYAGRVDACYVDGERVRAQAGDFYGGWILPWVIGPFKGGPGTRGW
ncbi:MAG: DUF427 domain-containing protein [Gammaproteobacteria bacterium]|jgi:uncharacterized protein (DUF427 family)|nr:DUF427 domain-containing protein [Gammaproteobacteria bacterium]